jgi:hypothetical protein
VHLGLWDRFMESSESKVWDYFINAESLENVLLGCY